MASRSGQSKKGSDTTTNVETKAIGPYDTSSAAESFGVLNNCHIYAIVLFIAYIPGGCLRATLARSFEKTGGTLTAVDSSALTLGTSILSSALVDLDCNGQLIRPMVTGIGGKTIPWTTYTTFYVTEF